MIGRVTQTSMQYSSMRSLQSNQSRLAGLQNQQSTGKILTRPSDDPAAAVDAMRLRTQQRLNTQYTRNTNDAVGWLSTMDSTLTTVSSQLTGVRNLIIQAGNGALSPTQREALASQLDAASGSLLGLANTQYMGRGIFAGTSTAESAFTANGDGTYTWTGNAGATVERRLNADTTVRVDADGASLFGTEAAGSASPSSLFAFIDGLAATLRDPAQTLDVSASLTRIDGFSAKVLSESSAVGTRYNQAQAAQASQQSLSISLTQQLSDVEDADLAETIIAVQTQQVAYQAALSATAQVLQPSLLDFLR